MIKKIGGLLLILGMCGLCNIVFDTGLQSRLVTEGSDSMGVPPIAFAIGALIIGAIILGIRDR